MKWTVALVAGVVALATISAAAYEFKPHPMAVCIDQEATAALKKLTYEGLRSVNANELGRQVRALCVSRFPDGASYFSEQYASTAALEKWNIRMNAELDRRHDEERKREADLVARDAPKLEEEQMNRNQPI
jgi:hypothetical protein